MGWLTRRAGLYRFVPTVGYQPYRPVRAALERLGTDAQVADLGAGGRRLAPNVRTVDFVDCGDTDVVADLHALPFADGALDGVITTGTLEHVTDVDRVLGEIRRVLKPGGILHVEVPFLQPFHADPHDYRRWTLAGLREQCQRYSFEEIDAGVHMGPSVTVAWILVEYCGLLLPGRWGGVLALAMRFLLWPLRFVDHCLLRRPDSHRLASGVYFTGRRAQG